MIDQVVDTPQASDIEQDAALAAEEGQEQEIFQKLYDLSDSEKEDILAEQNKRLRASLLYMTNLYPGMIKAFKKYRSIADPIKDAITGQVAKGRANLFIPYPWAIVETEMPRLAGRLPRVHAFPRKLIEEKKIEAIQDLIYYSLDRMGFLRLQQLWLRQFELYGFSPLVYYWRNETKKVFERTADPMTGGYSLKRVEKVIWDDFAGRVVDVFDSFLQPGVEQPEDGDWWMFREYVSEKDLKDRVAAGTLYPEVLDYVKDHRTGMVQRQNDFGRADRDSLIANQKDNSAGYSNQSYGRYELMWTLEDDRVVAMLDGAVLAACGDNPEPLQQKAMINLNLMPQVNEPIGVSTIEALAGLPDKLNAISNARMDNISLQVNRVILANRFAPIDFDNLVMTAGNVILGGENPEKDVQVLDIPDIGEASAREIITTKEELQFTTGISDFIVGVKSSSRLADTATGVSTIVREGNARFALKLATYEAYPLRRLVKAIHTYNMTFMPEEKRIHVLGPRGYMVKDIKLDDILCECDFLIEPGSSMPLDQLARRDAFLQLLDRAMKMPQVANVPKLYKEVIAAFEIPSPEDYVMGAQSPLPEAEDVELAQAENIALSQGQDIAVMGNDQLHLMVHQRGLGTISDPAVVGKFNDHIAQHQQRLQMITGPAMQAGQNALFGGQNGATSLFGQAPQPTQAPAGPAAGGPGAGAPVAGAPGVPQGPGGGDQRGNPGA